MLTFDEFGVSHHPNHIAVCHGVKKALQSLSTKGHDIQGFKLVSKNVVRKFIGPLDIIFAYIFSEYFIHKLSPFYTILGMMAHASQFVWYRKLFVLFSSYTYINSFVPIVPEL